MAHLVQKYFKYIKRIIKSKLHNFQNRIYWTKYYKSHRENAQPSPFAQYCFRKYCSLNKNAKILELGCGNGRDSIFFMKQGLNVLGLDIVREQLKYLRKKYVSSNNVTFYCTDFTAYAKPEFYDYIYSRFTIHVITEEQETLTLENCYKNLKKNGLLFIEVRSIKDEMFAKSNKISSTEGKTDHYRRFAVFDKLIEKITMCGFEIVEATESCGLAIYKDEDPCIIRIIAKK